VRHAGTLAVINPADVPDALNQLSGSVGGPFADRQDVLLRRRRLYAAGSDDVPVEHAAGVRVAGRWQPDLRGHYRQELVNARLDHKLTPPRR
jgi:hypothetical protein